MAVRLRLMRMGKKKQPYYRVVAADSRSPRDGRFIEIVGTYNPRPNPSDIAIDNAKAVKWLRNGALPSEAVQKLLKISGAWKAFEDGVSVEDLEAQAAQAEAADSTDAAPSSSPSPAPAPAAKTAEEPSPAEAASDNAAGDEATAEAAADDAAASDDAAAGDEAAAEEAETAGAGA